MTRLSNLNHGKFAGRSLFHVRRLILSAVLYKIRRMRRTVDCRWSQAGYPRYLLPPPKPADLRLSKKSIISSQNSSMQFAQDSRQRIHVIFPWFRRQNLALSPFGKARFGNRLAAILATVHSRSSWPSARASLLTRTRIFHTYSASFAMRSASPVRRITVWTHRSGCECASPSRTRKRNLNDWDRALRGCTRKYAAVFEYKGGTRRLKFIPFGSSARISTS